MHARELAQRRRLQMHVEALALADECAAIGGKDRTIFCEIS